MIHLPQQGDTHLPPLSTIWKALIYKVVIIGSLVPIMGNCKSPAQVHELFSEVHIECTETENKTTQTFC